jgi:hypothetical protein
VSRYNLNVSRGLTSGCFEWLNFKFDVTFDGRFLARQPLWSLIGCLQQWFTLLQQSHRLLQSLSTQPCPSDRFLRFTSCPRLAPAPTPLQQQPKPSPTHLGRRNQQLYSSKFDFRKREWGVWEVTVTFLYNPKLSTIEREEPSFAWVEEAQAGAALEGPVEGSRPPGKAIKMEALTAC